MADIATMKDDLDKVSIDQIHKVVLNLSTHCFELKKFCATIMVSFVTLVTIFTDKHLDYSVFIGSFVIVIFFWLLDSQSYFYQQKLRMTMKTIVEEMFARYQENLVVNGVGVPILIENQQASMKKPIIHSLFNSSMFFYLFLAILVLILGVAYRCGIIS